MTDWRQIQARIRKAKSSSDALAKLSELFQRTRDGMVAWELGAIEEKAERTTEAVKWYAVAAERFRRAEWKKKAEEALARLGVAAPAAIDSLPAEERPPVNHSEADGTPDRAEGPEQEETTISNVAAPEPSETPDNAYRQTHSEGTSPAPQAFTPPGTALASDAPTRKKRRRGRRGGRGRRRKEVANSSLPTQAFAASSESQPAPQSPEVSPPLPFRQPEPQPVAFERSAPVERPAPVPIRPTNIESPSPVPQLPSERMAHGRAGDPALASRMAHLESMLRRLLSSPLRRLDDLDQAPAGPGVFLLSDSDQISCYYVEACQTLRVGLSNLSRGGRGSKTNNRGGRNYSDSGLKAKLAEHLGINESKVGQYMKEHCVVRWIQLDEDAPHLAHFAIGVLRTPLNLEP